MFARLIVRMICQFTSHRVHNGRRLARLPLLALLLALSSQAAHTNSPFSNEISRGESFLTNLFEPDLNLLPEYRGAKVYWLYHDNYLAAKVLKSSRPDLAGRIEASIRRFGVTNSGKIELLFNEAPKAFPFHTYQLLDVTNIAGKSIRTERIVDEVLKGWEAYADLLLMAGIAKSNTAPDEAKGYFNKALALWDGRGFVDPAFKHRRIYATYKLALAIMCADALNQNLPFRSEALQALKKLQSDSGGWITDYDRDSKPRGMPNVETTCLAILALRGFK